MAEKKKYEYDPFDEGDEARSYKAQYDALAKPVLKESPWQQTVNDTLNKIMNREKFNYDLNGDALYQQYKDNYINQGKMAMMDTMGQAQAATGGYGNSYAQTVGQQTYQGYLQGLNDKVPELYSLALEKYNNEGSDLYNQYALAQGMVDDGYNKWRDEMSDYHAEQSRLLGLYEDARDNYMTNNYNRYVSTLPTEASIGKLTESQMATLDALYSNKDFEGIDTLLQKIFPGDTASQMYFGQLYGLGDAPTGTEPPITDDDDNTIIPPNTTGGASKRELVYPLLWEKPKGTGSADIAAPDYMTAEDIEKENQKKRGGAAARWQWLTSKK